MPLIVKLRSKARLLTFRQPVLTKHAMSQLYLEAPAGYKVDGDTDSRRYRHRLV